MGKVAEMKKKKKGRPSLLDLQKRSLIEQEQQPQNPNLKNPNFPNPNPNSTRRSTRRSAKVDEILPAPDWIEGVGDDDDERKEKKLKLLRRLSPNHTQNPGSLPNSVSLHSVSYASNSNADVENPEASLKKRKINAVGDGSGQTTAEKEEKVAKATDTPQGSRLESGPTTPLPDKKLLVFILDRLQKKDTHGVFLEPVDPEELPDYHDIIEHPMDFGTVRKKLDGGLYSNLEQFESDIFLICSNAMQYNAPDTVYFRQARTIQELAKRDFANLRQEGDDGEPQPKIVRRGRPPTKHLKKSLGSSPLEHVAPETSSEATLATGGDNSISSNSYNLRKGPTPCKFRPADISVKAQYGSRNSDNYSSWLSEWNNEFPASILKGVSTKHGKKPFELDENRRDTYKHPLASNHEPSVLTTLHGELKQLMSVGLHSDHGYARSLARFAADLGQDVWKIAAKKIANVLPVGVEFGPGWVGENEALAQRPSLLCENQKSSNNSTPPHPQPPPTTSGSSLYVANRSSLPCKEESGEAVRGLNSQIELTSRPAPPEIHQTLGIHPGLNGFSGGFGFNPSSQMGMARLAMLAGNSSTESMPSQKLGMVSNSSSIPIHPMQANYFASDRPESPVSSNTPRSRNLAEPGSLMKVHTPPEVLIDGKASWQGLPQRIPPDLNVRFQAPGSPSSSTTPIASSQQPDLALQL